MTNRERRALRRAKVREHNQKKAIKRSVAVNMQSVRANAYASAREPQDRFEVDPTRTWYVLRSLPRRATWAAEQIRAVGIPVFEAREAIRIVSEIGKRRTALIPVLRRLLFVGVTGWEELRKAESHPGVYDDLTGRSGVVQRPGGGAMVIAAQDLQNFADAITGFGGDMTAANRFLFCVGSVVQIKDGPFAEQRAVVEDHDLATGRMQVAVGIFSGVAKVWLNDDQVEAA